MTQTDQPTPPRRSIGILLKILLGLLVLSALVVALLPFAVQWYLEDWLRDRGVVNVSISDVDINSVYLAVTGTHIEGINNRGTFRLPEGEPEITVRHVEEAKEIAAIHSQV